MKYVMRILYVICLIGAIMFIVGICKLPQTGGDVIPQGESQEEYNKRQRQMAVESDGFKLAMGGMAVAALGICLIAYRSNLEEAAFYREEAARQRAADTRAQARQKTQVAPLVLTVAEPVPAVVPAPAVVPVPAAVPVPVPAAEHALTQVVVEEPVQPQVQAKLQPQVQAKLQPHIQIHRPLELYPYSYPQQVQHAPRAPVPFPRRVRFEYPPALRGI